MGVPTTDNTHPPIATLSLSHRNPPLASYATTLAQGEKELEHTHLNNVLFWGGTEDGPSS